MVYNPATDFLALWRNIAGNVTKLDMPGLDYMVSALARAGIITLSVSATAPVVSQSTTAWLQTAVPSYSAEGTLHLWDPVATAYAAATPALFFKMLQTAAAQSGVSWWTTTDGAPANTVGNDGDYALRTDGVGGIFGPKAAGAWPATPLPGTTNEVTSSALDNAFGSAEGDMLYRGDTGWQALPIGADNTIMHALDGVPRWDLLSALLDTVFGGVRGDILFRGAASWGVLPPGAATQVLQSGGPGADVAWAARTAEFPSGTAMLFQQSAAPTGWTKQTVINDYGLRVTSGAAGVTVGVPFSTVFAQTVVGDTTLSIAQMPAHDHSYSIYNTSAGGGPANGAGPYGNNLAGTTGSTGGGGAHSHSVNLTLAYVDVIIASKN